MDNHESIVHKVDDFYHFYHNFLDPHINNYNIENYIFRGEGNSDYKLYPGALRKLGVKKLRSLAGKRAEKFQNGSKLEAAAIVHFYRHANRHGLYVPNLEEFADYNRSIDDLYKILWKGDILQPKFYELYALAQHYYVPTRFIDWSFDIHVALWFAAYSNYKNKDKESSPQGFSLWILNYVDTRRLQVTYPEGSPEKHERKRDRYLKFVVPPYSNNANLKAQKGILTYLPIQRFVEKPEYGEYYGESLATCILRTAENNARKHTYIDNTKFYLMKYVFPSDQSGEVLCFLKSRGYDLTSIYPGYGRITDALKLEYELDILK